MDAKLLSDEYVLESQFADENEIHQRTSARYRQLGMPYLEYRGRIYIHIPGGRKWLEGRVRRLNPPRRGA
jgi:hypothetical protein